MTNEGITQIIIGFYPDLEAIYLFGSYGTADEWPDSDVDIALLFPERRAAQIGNPALSACRSALERALKKEVDLVNLRLASTVFQFQVVATGRLIYVDDEIAVQEFEMLTMSYYQKLNEERAAILEEFYKTGRAYTV